MRKTFKVVVSSFAALAMFGASFAPLATQAAVPTITIQGTLTAISGTSAPATLTVVQGATTFIVNVTTSTTLIRKFNGVSTLDELLLGDTLQIKGKLSDSASNTLDATRIKDLSVQRVGGTFKGSIVSLSCGTSLQFKPKDRAQQTVNISASTKILRGGEKITCTDLVAGEKALVIGLWRPSSKTIAADRIIVFTRAISGTITNVTMTSGTVPATITVSLKNNATWTINVSATTKLFRKYLGKATIDEFLVGDKVEARGTIATGNIMNAMVVRDNSVAIKNMAYEGTIKSIDTTNSTFVLTLKRKTPVDITVTTSTSTKYRSEETTKSFSDLTVGAKVKVLGTYTASTKTLAALRVHWED